MLPQAQISSRKRPELGVAILLAGFPIALGVFAATAGRFVIARFDAFRKKRNMTGYERVGAVSDQEAREIFQLAKQLRHQVEEWIKASHPKLLR